MACAATGGPQVAGGVARGEWPATVDMAVGGVRAENPGYCLVALLDTAVITLPPWLPSPVVYPILELELLPWHETYSDSSFDSGTRHMAGSGTTTTCSKSELLPRAPGWS